MPATLSVPSSNNAIESPTAWKTKGDDYNRNPVGTGPCIQKSWTAVLTGMVLEKNPDYWSKGHPYLDRITLKPLPDAQSRFGEHVRRAEADIVWDDEARCRQYPAGAEVTEAHGAQLCRFGRRGECHQYHRRRRSTTCVFGRPWLTARSTARS